MEISNEMVRYNFTQGELVELSREQARHFNARKQAEDELLSVKADFKNTTTKLEADINRCAQRVTSGYEMRNIKCLLLKFRPDNDSLLIVRTDNGRVLKRRKLNADERQTTLTTEAPDVYEFETDFYQDTDSDVTEQVAADVPLTPKEAKELKDVEGMRIRPLAKKITDGREN